MHPLGVPVPSLLYTSTQWNVWAPRPALQRGPWMDTWDMSWSRSQSLSDKTQVNCWFSEGTHCELTALIWQQMWSLCKKNHIQMLSFFFANMIRCLVNKFHLIISVIRNQSSGCHQEDRPAVENLESPTETGIFISYLMSPINYKLLWISLWQL